MGFSQHWEKDNKPNNGIAWTQCETQYWGRYPIMGFTRANVDPTSTQFLTQLCYLLTHY